jgi:plastocyanin
LVYGRFTICGEAFAMRSTVLALILFCAAPAATAGELSVLLKTKGGKGAANAVVMVRPQAGGRAAVRPTTLRMSQKEMQFEPFVLVAPVGSEVSFPNLDPVRHHVYSFSPAKVFELKLYSREESRAVRFDRPGVVAIGCNIHDDMSAFIRVVDTPYAGKTGANGTLVIRDLPAGPATVTVWHPHLKARGGEVTQVVNVPGAGGANLALTLDLKAPPVHRGMY